MLSHKYKCIFIHIPKVAGQSIEHVFLNLHGLTWDARGSLLLRTNDVPSIGPPKLAHLRASEYVSCGHVTQEEFDSYFKFAFIRNPWDRVVSIYKYLGYSKNMPFKKFLMEDFIHKEWKYGYWFVGPQYEYLFNDKNQRLVDYIGRFEDLQTGFDIVCTKIGIPQTNLPYVNRSDGESIKSTNPIKNYINNLIDFNKKKFDIFNHYTEYYDDESKDLVANLYEKDIEYFNYRFD